MKAISLWQPWASLIAVGAKKYETRSWATDYRGPIAIHAAKKAYNLKSLEFALIPGFIEAVGAAFGKGEANNLPLGAVVATAELAGCWRTHSREGGGYLIRKSFLTAGRLETTSVDIGETEALFGDFSPRRFAWELINVVALPEPVPAKGRQGLWNWGA